MSCSVFFHPFIDYLNQPAADSQIFNSVDFLLAGNRAETQILASYSAVSSSL